MRRKESSVFENWSEEGKPIPQGLKPFSRSGCNVGAEAPTPVAFISEIDCSRAGETE